MCTTTSRMLTLLLVTVAAGPGHAGRLQELAIPPISDTRAAPMPSEQPLPSPLVDKAGSRPSVDIVIGTSRVDMQQPASCRRMLAVSADGMVHGVYTSGQTFGPRDVVAWCADAAGELQSGPEHVLSTSSSQASCAVTGANPGNGVAPNSSVVALKTFSDSWLGIEFGSCSLAFETLLPQATLPVFYPSPAVDGANRIHMVGVNPQEETNILTVRYNVTLDGSTWAVPDGVPVTDNSYSPSPALVADPESPRAALLFLEPTGPEDIPWEGPPDTPDVTRTLHNDVMAFLAEDGDLLEELEAGNQLNLTSYGAESTTPFGPFGCRAYSSLEGLMVPGPEPALHVAFSAGVALADTIKVRDHSGEENEMVYCHWNLGRGQIWTLNVYTGEWGHIAGWNSGIAPGDFTLRRPQAWRMYTDRPSLAQDPATGFLYAVWNQYSPEDTSAAGFCNGEILARCSADNGLTWGPAVNLTNTPSPGCEPGDCDAEDWHSMAAEAAGGFLHLTWVHDLDAGGVPFGEGSETVNDVVYSRFHVEDIPPHGGEAWNSAGHVGLVHNRRWFDWPCEAWSGPDALLDSARWEERIHVFNESPYPVGLADVSLYHHPADLFGSPQDGGLVDAELWVQVDGAWVWYTDWNGVLDAWRSTSFRLELEYAGLPSHDQLLVFHFNNRPDLVYRIAYPDGSDTECPLVEPLDPEQLAEYDVYFFDQGGVNDPQNTRGFTLEANWPNPFNPTTSIAFTRDHAGAATLQVHNLLGETVATLVDGPVQAGRHTVDFDASALASGVYIYTLKADGRRESRKLVVLK